ncbi:MAG: hypothetical protein Q8K18_07355 [Burkholderiales bacterium]|nr:hypothetical protein [Burkholderiales bacterium]
MYFIAQVTHNTCHAPDRVRSLSIQGENSMSKKLGIGDTFPNLTLNLVKGGTINLPGGMGSKYGVILFYRGHW